MRPMPSLSTRRFLLKDEVTKIVKVQSIKSRTPDAEFQDQTAAEYTADYVTTHSESLAVLEYCDKVKDRCSASLRTKLRSCSANAMDSYAVQLL